MELVVGNNHTAGMFNVKKTIQKMNEILKLLNTEKYTFVERQQPLKESHNKLIQVCLKLMTI